MYQTIFHQSLATRIAVIILLVSWNQRSTRAAETCHKKFQQFSGHSACRPKSSGAVSFDLTSDEKQALVNQHNELRGTVDPAPADMLKMSWDDEVAMIAQKWTDSCEVYKGNTLQHDKNYHRFIPGRFSVGQNLAAGHRSFAEAINDWYGEKKDYTYGEPKSTISKMVGHYTQLVWSESYKLGCSKTKCSNRMIYACNYAPAGNMGNFKSPYESGQSKCSQRIGNLCDCGDLECANGSPLNVSTCTCSCTSEHYLDSDCKFSCKINDTSYCGRGSHKKSECDRGPYVVSTAQQCPHLCNVCPYADPGYRPRPEGKSKGKGSANMATPSMTLVFGLVGLLVLFFSM